MYIIRGNFFGSFIASGYFFPFFLATLLVQVPTPSFISVVMFLVGDADIFTDPFGSPTLPLLVVVAFLCGKLFLATRGQGHGRKTLCNIRTVLRVDVPFIWASRRRFSSHDIYRNIVVGEQLGDVDGVRLRPFSSFFSYSRSITRLLRPSFQCPTLPPITLSSIAVGWMRSRTAVVAPAVATARLPRLTVFEVFAVFWRRVAS